MSGHEEKMHAGRIGRIEEIGLGVIVDEDDKTEYPFTLDKIEGYHGEPLKALGLRKGSAVQFNLHRGKVATVKIQE